MSEGKQVAKEPKARKQTPREHVVLEEIACEPKPTYLLAQGGLSNTKAAAKWRKDVGTLGASYQIACFIGEPKKVVADIVEKRRVVSV